jgi:hypothetical protein
MPTLRELMSEVQTLQTQLQAAWAARAPPFLHPKSWLCDHDPTNDPSWQPCPDKSQDLIGGKVVRFSPAVAALQAAAAAAAAAAAGRAAPAAPDPRTAVYAHVTG